MTTQTKGRTVPLSTNGVTHDDTSARMEARLAELREHHKRLAEELRIVGVVIGEMEAILNGPVVTEGAERNGPPSS